MSLLPEARAREPDLTGSTARDGVQLVYDVYGAGSGAGDVTVLLMPTWSIVDSRFWKAQVGYLSRHYRVVTFDGRGSGRSGRPRGAAAYTDEEYAADAVAVLDATGTAAAVLVALSRGVAWSVHVAAEHPNRVLGLFAMAASCSFTVQNPARDHLPWEEPLGTTEGWAKYNKHHWLHGGYADFTEFFFRQMYPEAHSTKQIEDCVRWAAEAAPDTLCDTVAGRLGLEGATYTPLDPFCERVRCPVTVVHGTDDAISPLAVGKRLAELTAGRLVVLDGAGHGPMARHPVAMNLMIREFVDALRPTRQGDRPEQRRWVSARRRPRKALYLSSPIGLGHAMRDVAIAQELRLLQPGLRIDWLAQAPVIDVLEAAGESVHPASAWLASEVAHIEHEAGEHDLHAFQAIRRMDALSVHNFMIFQEVLEAGDYDLVVGDEAWDVDYFLHENPELKRFSFAWMTDFVGWLPMPSGGDEEAALTADYNAEMIEQRARYARVRDRSVFVGNAEDIVPERFGPGLPMIGEWVRENFDFAGYVTGFDPGAMPDQRNLRRRLGHREDERLCVVTVGGSGVGSPLLRRVLQAVPLARAALPDLRFLVVSGPRIDPHSMPTCPGAEVRGHVPDLYQHLAAADLAVVQGGFTTCMELIASRRPFVYVPLRNHFEQNFHVRHRLERYGAGLGLDYEEATDPDAMAAAIIKEIGREVDYREVETDGAARAAELLAELL